MIGKLQGLVDYIGDNYAIIMVGMCLPIKGELSVQPTGGGIGYRVFCPVNVLSNLKTGEFATLWIETNVREDHIHLFGFDTRESQDLFLKLTTVSGVGPKMGMAIMGALDANTLMGAIATGDANTLTAAPGVGKKVAERIIVELKGKVGAYICATTSGREYAALQNSAYADLLCALETLGYRRGDCAALAQKLTRENPDADVAKLVPLALKEIGR